MTNSLPLAGVRVIDLTHLWAGPLCSSLLARLGADVLKVEGPKRPDPLSLLAEPPHGQPSYETLNAGKKIVMLDLATVEGRAALLDLIRSADGVVDNFSPRARSNWGLDPAAAARELDVLWISLPSFPAGSQLGHYAARGAGVEGGAGLAALHAHNGVPGLLETPLSDPLAGLRAAFVFASSFRDGRGHHIEVSQFGAAREVAALVRADGVASLPSVPPIRSAA